MSLDYSKAEADEHHDHHHHALVTVGDLANLLYPLLPDSAMFAFARANGRLRAQLGSESFECVVRNIASVPGVTPAHARKLAVQGFMEREIRSLLLVLTPQLELEAMKRMYGLEGIHYLDEALAKGKGAFLLLSHMHSLGAFLAVSMFRRMGYDVQVALPSMDDPWSASRVRQLIHRVTGPKPNVPELIGGFYCQFNIRPIVQRLRQNVIIAQTGDGWHSAAFVDCEFFGRTLPFTTGVASVAKTTGAAIVPLFVTGAAPKLTFRVEEPYTIDRDAPDVVAPVRRYVARLEHHLKDNLHAWEHWLVPNTFEAMAAHRDKTLREKYVVGHG